MRSFYAPAIGRAQISIPAGTATAWLDAGEGEGVIFVYGSANLYLVQTGDSGDALPTAAADGVQLATSPNLETAPFEFGPSSRYFTAYNNDAAAKFLRYYVKRYR